MSTSVRRAVRRAALEAWLSQADEVLARSPTGDHPTRDPSPREPASTLRPTR